MLERALLTVAALGWQEFYEDPGLERWTDFRSLACRRALDGPHLG